MSQCQDSASSVNSVSAHQQRSALTQNPITTLETWGGLYDFTGVKLPIQVLIPIISVIFYQQMMQLPFGL